MTEIQKVISAPSWLDLQNSHPNFCFVCIRGPSSTLHGNTAQSFPWLPGHHPRNRRGPGHPGGREHGGGGRGADAQSAGGPELRHPQWHGVRAGSYQDRQGELPHMVIEDASGALLPPLPTLWTAACSNLWRIHRCFYKTFQRASLDFCLCLGVLGQPSFEAVFFSLVCYLFILSVSSRLAHEQTITQGSPNLPPVCQWI